MKAAQQRAARRRTATMIVPLIVLGVVGATLLAGRGGSKDSAKKDKDPSTVKQARPAVLKPVPAGQNITGPTPCPNADGSSPRATTFAGAPPTCIDPAKTYKAILDTTEGTIEVNLDTQTTPGTVNNFVVLSRYHYYDLSALHRTDPSIDIIQGGSPGTQSASDPGPGYTIKDEGGPPRHYTEGDLVMARTSGPDSGGAQFFFVAGAKAAGLDSQGTYVTFGKVGTGLDLVKKILALHAPYPQGDPKASLGGAPRRAVIIRKVQIVES